MKKFAVIGDSHSVYFKQLNKIIAVTQTHWDANAYRVADLSSATVRGLGNPNSTLGVATTIDKLIDEFQPELMVFGLGQVDLAHRKGGVGELGVRLPRGGFRHQIRPVVDDYRRGKRAFGRV